MKVITPDLRIFGAMVFYNAYPIKYPQPVDNLSLCYLNAQNYINLGIIHFQAYNVC